MGKQALDGKRLNAFGMDPNDVIVVTDPTHPLFDREGNDLPIDEAMIASIVRHGVLKPAIVWKDGENVLLVDGRQRRKNTIEANRRGADPTILLPVMIFRGTLAEAAELMEELNELRRENSPMVRARRVLRMTQRGRSIPEIAALLGKHPLTIENSLKLLDCSEAIQADVEAGRMSATAAIKLTSLPRAEQDKAVAEMRATKEAIAAEGSGEESGPAEMATEEKPARKPRTVGPKRTASGAVTKATLRKVYERANSPENEAFENALTDGERKLLGWALGKLSTEDLAREVPGIRLLLGIGPAEPSSVEDAPEVDVEEPDEDERDDAESLMEESVNPADLDAEEAA